jgi:ABC-type amino acid transport substrate-binding protein
MSRSLYLAILVFLGLALSCRAVDNQISQPLRVAVFDRPPYTFKNDDGIWSGVAIELWEQIARQLNIPFSYVDVPLAQVSQALQKGEVDITPSVALRQDAVGLIDYTTPFLVSSIAAQTTKQSLRLKAAAFWQSLRGSGIFLLMAAMLAALITFSLVIMLLERKKNDGHFSEVPPEGHLLHSLWFSALTMMCLEYDVALRLSFVGRMLAYMWSFAGILFLTVFTGAAVSAFSSAESNGQVTQLEDLAHFRTGVYTGSATERELRNIGVPVRGYNSPEEGLAALARGEITAFADDAIPINYIANNNYPGQFTLSSIPSHPMLYAMASHRDLPCFPAINRSVQEITLAPDWASRIQRWTGPMNP